MAEAMANSPLSAEDHAQRMAAGLSLKSLARARELVASRLCLDFSEGREGDLERGLLRAAGAARSSLVRGPEAYCAWLATLPDGDPEWRRLAGHFTARETSFFDDRACFEVLEHQVFPSLLVTRGAEGIRRLRIWSAGCATGEEPYSLAILLDRLLPRRAAWTLTILATDINPSALKAAGRGVYRQESLRETPAGIRDRYFHRRGAQSFELDRRIRGMVAFAPLDLAQDEDPARAPDTRAMDLIVCRNALRYSTREVQQAALARIHEALVPGGWLVASPARASADLLRPMVPVKFSDVIIYRKELESSPGGQPSAGWGLAGPLSLPRKSFESSTVRTFGCSRKV